MNEGIISNWNSLIRSRDEVYHLGDFAFCKADKAADILERLNGRLHLIYGNHDQIFKKDMRNGNRFLSKYFVWQRDYHELKIDKRRVILNHYPILAWNMQAHGSIHFYGHTHGSIPEVFRGQSKDVGLDTNECFPYSVGHLIQELDDIREDECIEIVDARNRGRV